MTPRLYWATATFASSTSWEAACRYNFTASTYSCGPPMPLSAITPRLYWAGVGSEESPIEGLASVRRSNGTCGFPAFRFHEWLHEVRREGISETRLTMCIGQHG